MQDCVAVTRGKQYSLMLQYYHGVPITDYWILHVTRDILSAIESLCNYLGDGLYIEVLIVP